MCEVKGYNKMSNPRIDKCMQPLISYLKKEIHEEIKACCCGHGKYEKTIVVKNGEETFWELFSGKIIPRKRRFYKRDNEGYYYIPELVD